MIDDIYTHTIFQTVKVDNGISCPCDFNGAASPLSVAEQKEFLEKQYSAYEERYSRELNEKVVSDEELRNLTKGFTLTEKNPFRNKVLLRKANAYAVKRREYENLVVYTKKTKIVDDVFVFCDCDNYPIPCAKIEVADGVKFFDFDIDIDKIYYTARRSPDLGTVNGRSVSFRKDGQDLLQLMFYPFGVFAVKNFVADFYHPEVTELRDFPFGEKFNVSASFDGKTVTVKTDGGENAFTISETPNEIFIGGGMLPVGTWRLFPNAVIDEKGKRIDVFKPYTGEETEEFLGKVNLPFAIGTAAHKDETLRLETHYKYKADGRKTILDVSTIDPDGEIFVNGEKVFGVNDYRHIRADVTDYLKEGTNSITFTVNPRAPEILYWWHKHKDPYCGYGVGVAYVEKIGDTYVSGLKIATTKINYLRDGCKIGANFSARVYSAEDKTVKVKILLSEGGKCRVVATESFSVERGENELNIHASFTGTPWSPDNPFIYGAEVRVISDGKIIDRYYEETGFRKIESVDGKILLNGNEIIMKGALLMQFMPPYEEIPINHVFPSTEQIFLQAAMAKKMRCNTVRMHQLGYGTNDRRFARVFDRLGVMCIWTTRLIDVLSTVLWNKQWKQKDFYAEQMKEVVNSPSVVMWEGINEIHVSCADIDNAYREFVKVVYETDKTRLICPISNIYYVDWYNDDGTKNKNGDDAISAKEWNHPSVVRSAHPYIHYLGYGFEWGDFRNQKFDEQENLVNSEKHAYIMSEYAIMGKQNPDTPEATKYIKKDSYELDNELKLGYDFDFKLSQAYQALAAEYTTRKALSLGVDGILWCCLQGGANDASYLKPPIDFYGYPKAAFFALKNYFAPIVCFADDIETVWGNNYVLKPIVISGGDGRKCKVVVTIKDERGKECLKKSYEYVELSKRKIALEPIVPRLKNGYYVVEYSVKVLSDRGNGNEI